MVYFLILLAGLLIPGVASAQNCIGALQSSNNLSDVCAASTARTNIGANNADNLNAGTVSTSLLTVSAASGGAAFVIDGGGSAITTTTCSFSSGQLCTFRWPYACTLAEVSMLADQTGSIVVEIAKTTYSSFAPGTHPVSGDKITSSTPPTISSAAKSDDTTLSGWTTSISAGDIYGLSVTSASTVTRVTVNFRCTKT